TVPDIVLDDFYSLDTIDEGLAYFYKKKINDIDRVVLGCSRGFKGFGLPHLGRNLASFNITRSSPFRPWPFF
ncbi:MAG: hypothetical protein ACKO5Q_13035, partial [Microcystaceae cyanobacterium]